jgi:hypothetical protein
MEFVSMFIIIRKDAKLSSKTNFIIRLLREDPNNKIFFVFKIETEKFKEKWCYNYVQLPSSMVGIITYYFLLMLRSPDEFRNALLRRLSFTKPKHVLIRNGFLSMLRETLYLHFGNSVRSSMLMDYLRKLDSPRFFLIDEFVSLNCLDLRALKRLGSIIYVSQDIAYNRYDFAGNLIIRNLIFRLEQEAIANFDLIVTCSERERLKYLEMGARTTIVYPNIYPTEEFEPCDKDEIPSISIVLRDHWGFVAEQSLSTILDALAYLNRQVRVYMIGIRPKRVPKNVKMEHRDFIPSKLEYLNLLSKSWIGINIGIHMSGTNERKYDYAEAGTVVFSDTLGARGDLLPHEYTYVDSHDLAAKINQLLEFGKVSITEMGAENRKHVLSMAEKARQRLLGYICKIIA